MQLKAWKPTGKCASRDPGHVTWPSRDALDRCDSKRGSPAAAVCSLPGSARPCSSLLVPARLCSSQRLQASLRMERTSVRRAALGLLIAAVVAQVKCGSSRLRRVSSLQVLGFDWKNCGQPDDPAVMKTLALSPDPIQIPGDLTALASGSTSVELSSPLSINVTLEKKVAGYWVKVPCLEDLGSCHYPDVCDILNQLIPPGQDCPEPLHTYGLPCHCPFKAGSYSLPQSDFQLPNVDLPYWLTNGNYRIQGVLCSQGKELGCLLLILALHSS